VASDIGLAVVTTSTSAVAAGGRDHANTVTGQPVAGLPPPSAMAGVVQPRGHDGVELRCLVCGQLFVAKRRDRRTCSPRCAGRDRAARRPALEALDGTPCKECGRVFVGGRADRRYCHPRCRTRAYRRRRQQVRSL
jgi:hypothetical protein